ncbi:MAG TPA: GNAT family N-acetyltransferase [Tepidisphaeraceae bacterium]|nr:GNAT family N-acetyltransferase [Tepidisphaeraceae bacterium]
MSGLHKISIRGIRESDLAAYKALRLEALREHPESFGTDYEEDGALPESVWVERVRKAVEDPGGRIVLADAGDELAGMVGVHRNPGAKTRHAASIWGVYVRPQYRGKRMVDQMIEEILNWCRPRGVRIVRLSATPTGPAARCYQRCGFQVYGVSPEEIRVGEKYYDELLMWRRV